MLGEARREGAAPVEAIARGQHGSAGHLCLCRFSPALLEEGQLQPVLPDSWPVLLCCSPLDIPDTRESYLCSCSK